MRKNEFLKKLSDSLNNLPSEEKRDILYDYEEHFRMGNENGKSQDEIVELLGDPLEIAKQYEINNNEITPPLKTKSKKIYAGVLILIFIALCIPVLLAIFRGGFNLNNTKKNTASNIYVKHSFKTHDENNSVNSLTETKSLNINIDKRLKLNGINQLNVSSSAPSIKIIIQDRTDIEAKLYGKINISSNGNGIKIENPELKVETEGSTRTIEIIFPASLTNILYNEDLNLDVYLPKIYSNNLKLTTLTGDINVDKLNLKNINFQTATGNIVGNSIAASNAELKTTSGNIIFNNYCGNVNCYSVSGETEIEYSNFKNNDVQTKSISGNIIIGLPKTCLFSIDASTVSGTISNDFNEIKNEGTTEKHLKGSINSSNNKISIANVSGNIQIKKTSPL